MAKCALLDDSLLRSLECSICFQVMKPPIIQCIRGHSICRHCKARLMKTTCPSCGDKFFGTRNFLAEELSLKIPRPCCYIKDGCHFKAVLSEMQEHQMDCTYRPYKCPVGESRSCIWLGRRDIILQHCRQKHKTMISRDGIRRVLWKNPSFATGRYRCFLVLFDNELFWFYIIVDPTHRRLFVCVQLIGPKDRALSYKYSLKFESQNPAQQLSYANFVHNDNSSIMDIITSRTCLEMSEGLARCFIHGDKFVYNCTIERVLANNEPSAPDEIFYRSFNSIN